MTREKIEALQMKMYQNYAKIQELRKELEPELVNDDYTFLNAENQPVKLSELFGDHSTLLVVHNMGRHCSYCTAWTDGYSGIYDLLKEKTSFVVSSPDAPRVQMEVKTKRDWVFPMVSLGESSFALDLGFQVEGGYHPGVSVFIRDEAGLIKRTWSAPFGPSDHYGIVWHTLDLLPENPMV